MKRFELSPALSLPADAVTQKLAFLARTGAGKTYTAMKLCEEMLAAGAQVVALDPVGVWWGLRLAADGKGEGFSIPVFGGQHGDVPLEPESGALVADLIVDRGVSAVLDVSMFETKQEHKRFATDFANRLFFRKKSSRSPVHIFFEEAQEFVPQYAKGNEKMLGTFERLIKLGRNFGIGASLISQRPQSVNKDVLNQTECLFALQTTGPHERKAIEDWIKDKGLKEDIAGLLPKLRIGEARVWSPQWLGVSETVRISAKRTFDASATPTFGGKAEQARELSPVDVDEIRRSMADVVARAEQNDPEKLKREVARLKRELAARDRQLAARQAETKTAVETKMVEVPVITDAQLSRLEKMIERLAVIRGAAAVFNECLAELKNYETFMIEGARRLKGAREQSKEPAPRATSEPRAPARARMPLPPIERNDDRASGDMTISRTQQRILDALAWFESIGNPEPSNLQIGAVALIDSTGGHFSNTVGPLSSAGLIIRGDGRMRLTDAGRARASLPDRAATLDAYHDVLRARVLRARSASRRTVDILDAVIRRGGAEVANEELGREVGIDHTGGHFSNTIGPLSTLGLIERRSGVVRPTEILFPKGLD